MGREYDHCPSAVEYNAWDLAYTFEVGDKHRDNLAQGESVHDGNMNILLAAKHHTMRNRLHWGEDSHNMYVDLNTMGISFMLQPS
jgi:hypothetical protein